MYKNVNTNIMLCKDIMQDTRSGCKSYVGLFDIIKPKEFDGQYYLHDIRAVIKNSIMWDSSIADRKDCLQLNKEYTLALCLEENGSNGMQCLLYKEPLNITNIINNGNYLLCNTTVELNIDRLMVPDRGNYSLCVFIQEKSSDEDLGWVIQSILPITVGF